MLIKCPRAEVDHVRKFVTYAKQVLNATRYFPPVAGYRYIAALALYSKCITVAEATMHLIDSEYYDEAFGMTRTLVDINITLRYIANKDSDARAKLFCQFFAKDVEGWSGVIKNYWPNQVHTMDTRTQNIAANYPHPHRWSGKTVSAMALEEDTVDLDPATQKPFVDNFSYEVIYRWTSHYVHPTIVALQNHLVQAGHDNFVVHSGNVREPGHMAAFNVATYVSKTLVSFYRCMGDPQPKRLAIWAESLMRHLARRHN